jgi:O-antigen/teichoic acid export membrane protein
MSIVPVLITVDKVLSEIVMVNVGLSEQLPRIYMIIGAINLILLWPLIHFYVVNGAAVSLVVSEAVALLLMFYSIKKMLRS